MMSENGLKRKIEDLKEENDTLGLGIQRTRLSIKRLKLEYSILLERLEARLEIDPELNYENPLPTLESFKKELLSKPLKKGKSKTQKAKDRDPNLPKRPTNAYLLFCEVHKGKIREAGTQDVTKAMAEAWKKLDEEGRKPFYKMYNDDRDRYKKEMEEYMKKNSNKQVSNNVVKDEQDTDSELSNTVKIASKENIELDLDDDDDEDEDDENEYDNDNDNGEVEGDESEQEQETEDRDTADVNETDGQEGDQDNEVPDLSSEL